MKTLKTLLILLGMVAAFLIIAWGIDNGWIWYPAAAIFLFVMIRYVWSVATEIRKTFFDKEEYYEND